MIDLMWTPEIRISDSESWGLGWEVNQVDSTRVVSHGGDLPGYQATIMVAPHRRAGFVFLANANTLPLAFAGEFALQPIQRWVATGQAPDAIRIPAVRLFTLGVLLLITFLIVRDVISIARTKDRVSNIRSAQRPAVALGVSLLGAAILPAIVAYIVTIGVFADALVMFPDALALLAVGTVIALIKGVVLIIRFAREAA
jgi:hypothetical protein